MKEAPVELFYQSELLILIEEKEMKGIKGKPTRYVYVNRAGECKLMQFQFSRNQAIDWQRLAEENTEAHDYQRQYRTWRKQPVMSKELKRTKKNAYNRKWWAKHRAEQNRKRTERYKAKKGGGNA